MLNLLLRFENLSLSKLALYAGDKLSGIYERSKTVVNEVPPEPSREALAVEKTIKVTSILLTRTFLILVLPASFIHFHSISYLCSTLVSIETSAKRLNFTGSIIVSLKD